MSRGKYIENSVPPVRWYGLQTGRPATFDNDVNINGTINGPIARTADKIITNEGGGGDYIVSPLVDVAPTIAQAIATMPVDTSAYKIVIRGQFYINQHVAVPSNVTIEVDAVITTSTLRPQTGDTNWADNMGVFELGNRTTKPIISNAWVIFTPNAKIVGDYFNVGAVSYPQDKVNKLKPGVTDPTIQFQLDVCAVHSYCTLINSGALDVVAENMHGVVRFESLGRTPSTPSTGWKASGRGLYTIVGIELYCNGYQSDDGEVPYYYGENSLDDMVAIVGSNGGISAGTGVNKNIRVGSIMGKKNGLRGSGFKLDGGTVTAGNGQVRNIQVGSINVSTSVQSLSGVTQDETIFYPILMGNINSKNIDIQSVVGTGWWHFGWRADMSGVDYHIGYFYAEAQYGFALKSPIVPNDAQKIVVNDGILIQRNGASGESGSIGVALMGGAVPQGFKNVSINVKTSFFDTPLAERGISGIGVDGTITNVEYDIDVMNKAATDLNLTSTNRRLTIRKYGQLQKTIYPFPTRTPSSATDAGVAGEVVTDGSYIYVCTADNTWKRSAITTW